MEDEYKEQSGLDMFSNNVKSSVKIKKTTRGITWDIKVVTGEKDLIDELMQSAVDTHKKLEAQLNIQGGK